jgi:MarR family transcriptional regulator for hemolysin
VQPAIEPIGLEAGRTGRLLSRAFDDVLAREGASLPVWLVLVTLKRDAHTMQREIAAAVGIEGATLTHHLNHMEATGLVRRRRPDENRRTQVVELTEEGEALFARLLGVVVAFDRRLRDGFRADELTTLRALLERLRTNATTAALPPGAPPA